MKKLLIPTLFFALISCSKSNDANPSRPPSQAVVKVTVSATVVFDPGTGTLVINTGAEVWNGATITSGDILGNVHFDMYKGDSLFFRNPATNLYSFPGSSKVNLASAAHNGSVPTMNYNDSSINIRNVSVDSTYLVNGTTGQSINFIYQN
jgi:hypothetical protein